MTIEELSLWDFNPELAPSSEIKCDNCGEWTPYTMWIGTCIPCSECGEHDAIKCPHCDKIYDHVWSEPFKTRIKL